jgi:predicted  nucleic acid-binding Zn-ribbon protein
LKFLAFRLDLDLKMSFSIADDLKKLYTKLAEENNGNGAAPLVGNECKGCHLTINTTEISRIATLPADEVVRCEQCRCILVRE